MIVTLISLILIIVLASLVLWVAQQFITDPMILKVVRVLIVVVVVLLAVLFLADLFGVSTGLHLHLRS